MPRLGRHPPITAVIGYHAHYHPIRSQHLLPPLATASSLPSGLLSLSTTTTPSAIPSHCVIRIADSPRLTKVPFNSGTSPIIGAFASPAFSPHPPLKAPHCNSFSQDSLGDFCDFAVSYIEFLLISVSFNVTSSSDPSFVSFPGFFFCSIEIFGSYVELFETLEACNALLLVIGLLSPAIENLNKSVDACWRTILGL